MIENELSGTSAISWRDASFAKSTKVYYNQIFNETREDKDLSTYKDELLIKIINYFTGAFDEKPNKPNPSSQNKETILLSDNAAIKGLNLRKLTELVPIIKQLSDTKKQIEMILENVYFSYEYILALILTSDSKLSNWHEYVVNSLMKDRTNAKAKLLSDVSSIFNERFKQFEKHPEFIVIGV